MSGVVRILKRCSFYAVGFLVFLYGALLLVERYSDTELQPWHKIALQQEFGGANALPVNSFSDYLALEDRLFAELREKIYSEVPTDKAHQLWRYSEGSLADPGDDAESWNRSFELTTPQPRGGVLLLHGMSDSPYSLRALGQELQRQGYQVLGLRLPGHGTAPSGLVSVSWQQMDEVVGLAMDHLAESLAGKPIHIAGYSTGAPLALNYSIKAVENDAQVIPASLVLISPAIGVSPAAVLASWKRRLGLLPGLDAMQWLGVQPEFDPYKYNSFATNAAEQVYEITSEVSRKLAELGEAQLSGLPPILVLKSTVDATTSTDAVVDRLLNLLPAGRNEFVLFDINRHAVQSSLLVNDPGPFTRRLMGGGDWPFAVTLVTNTMDSSRQLVVERKLAQSAELVSREALPMAWPRGIFSLSHVALPFSPDDSLYGATPPADSQQLFLGHLSIQGERGLLVLPADWLLRLRYNPFYSFLQQQSLGWIEQNSN